MPFHKAISKPDNPYHLDTFYNKKRNFPNAEEREYDYAHRRAASLVHNYRALP